MPPFLADATRALVAAYLIAMMFSMGLQLGGGPPEDKQTKHRQRRLIVRALAFNLIVLPLMALSMTRMLGAAGDVAIAFLLLAASPGGRFAPHLTRVAGGDLELSVEITLFLVKVVSLTAPITVGWMLHVHRVEISEVWFIAQLLVLQLLPYLAGKQLKKRRGALAARLERPLSIAAAICGTLSLMLVLLTHPLRDVRDLSGDRGWLAVVAFAPLTLLLGWLLGGPTPATRRAFSLSGNARNLALALLLANGAFPERGVQLAAFAVWTFFSAFDCACAWVAGSASRHRVPRLREQP